MKNHETGEFELVLGTVQLLSWFVMLSMLFAGFFVTGYKAGRNAAPPTRLKSRSKRYCGADEHTTQVDFRDGSRGAELTGRC